jgi:hypothetical protein
MISAYDKARDLVQSFAAQEGMFDADFDDDDGSFYAAFLTDAGEDWLVAEIEKALKQAGMK